MAPPHVDRNWAALLSRDILRPAGARAEGGDVLTALRRPLLVAIVLGVSTAISATGRVTPSLVLSTTLCWSFVVVLQAVIAIALIAAPARRTVGLPRALDLFFAGHAPWSLWMLAAAAWAPSPIGRPLTPLLVGGRRADPAHASHRQGVLPGKSWKWIRATPLPGPRRSRRFSWGAFVALFGTAVAFAPRILEWFA